MRIAILSDFHLGYERFREDAYKQAQEALGKAADMADVIVIPGDIFDSRVPKPDVIAEAINLFRGLSKREWGARVVEFRGDGQHYTDIPVIAIPGTHERRAQDVTDPVDLLGLTGLVVDVSNATAVVQKGDERVAIVGIGGIADERFREVVMGAAPKPVPGAFSIFMFHESVYEFLPFNESFIRQDELPKGFDLYVCGHIHNKIDSDVHGKKFLIPGSTVLTQLKPGEQERKGFYVYDTVSGKYEFEKIESRRFVMLKVGIGEAEQASALDIVEGEIEKVIGDREDMPVIRVVIERKGSRKVGIELDLSGLAKRYQSKALIELSSSGIDMDSIRSTDTGPASPAFENMSVKDYGIGIFVEKLRSRNVSFGKVSPVELFDMLSEGGNKESIVSSTLSHLLE